MYKFWWTLKFLGSIFINHTFTCMVLVCYWQYVLLIFILLLLLFYLFSELEITDFHLFSNVVIVIGLDGRHWQVRRRRTGRVQVQHSQHLHVQSNVKREAGTEPARMEKCSRGSKMPLITSLFRPWPRPGPFAHWADMDCTNVLKSVNGMRKASGADHSRGSELTKGFPWEI